MRAGVHDMSRAEALSALRWWRDAGVDTLVDEAPRDWLKAKASTSHAAARQTRAPASDDQAAQTPVWPITLPAFRAWLEAADALPDESRPGHRLLPSGDPTAGLMVLLDMPEPADAAAGTLLSGEPGKLFDAMLAAIGRSRETIYLASLCLARAPGGRLADESFDRVAALARHHVALAAPERLLLMGNLASRALLEMNYATARNGLHLVNRGETSTAVTIAPQLLLQNPSHKGQAWKDLRLLTGGNGTAC